MPIVKAESKSGRAIKELSFNEGDIERKWKRKSEGKEIECRLKIGICSGTEGGWHYRGG